MWRYKWECWKHKVNLDEISAPRLMFFKTKPTEEQIFLLEMQEQRMVQRMVLGWTMMAVFGLVIGFFAGAFAVWLQLTGGF